MRGGSKDGERDDKRDDKIGDEEEKDEEEQGKNPHHTYKDLDRTIHTIFRDKVALETGRERKLTARAIMAVANSDEKTIDPKYQNWSHRAITFSRADQWAKISKPGRFPLVLDLVIKNIRFEKVLIDDGSALDILFRNALTELGLKPEDLKPYDTPFWGCSQGRPLIP
jgi:hypothetical protein